MILDNEEDHEYALLILKNIKHLFSLKKDVCMVDIIDSLKENGIEIKPIITRCMIYFVNEDILSPIIGSRSANDSKIYFLSYYGFRNNPAAYYWRYNLNIKDGNYGG